MATNDTLGSEVLEEVLEQLEERKRFFRIDGNDEERLRAFRDVAVARSSDVIEPLYEHFLAFGATRGFFQNDRHLTAVKETQVEYLKRLFDGRIDNEYARDRLRVGITHERIGLEPAWYIGAYTAYLALVRNLVDEEYAEDPERAREVFQSILKAVTLDMSMAIDTYIGSMREREKQTQDRFVSALSEYSETLGGSTAGILEATSGQAAAAQEQASSVSEITATLGELRQTSAQALERAEEVVRVSERSTETSAEGSAAVEASIQGMREVREQVEAIADKILMLSEQSQQIGEIITSVNEIAEQSKLLAFNASIEAGRAGEHGKGFAVVAAEMRSLADQSKEATGQVRQLLSEIQTAINQAVLATEEGTRKVEAGTELANRSGSTIHELARCIEEASNAARLIANAARQQAAGVEQASDGMTQINDAVNQSAASMRQIQTSAESLDGVTRSMRELIATFTESDDAKVADFRLA